MTESGIAVAPGGELADIAGRTLVMHYGRPDDEYAALRSTAIVVDRSHRSRLTFSGAKAAETLTGLVTNDVLALTPGHGQYAAALTSKGKIIADLRIFAREQDFLIDVPPRAAEGMWAMVRKYVNPRLARYADVSAALAQIGVFGLRARSLVGNALDLDGALLEGLPPYAHLEGRWNNAAVLVARVPDLGLDGFELFVAPEPAAALRERLHDLGGVPAGLSAFEIARVEAGRAEWGLDIDESTLTQEANLDDLDAVSYTKGCYTGQETVARVHFRGHVNRHLRGLRSDGVLPVRAQLYDNGGKLVGDVRSAALSPRLGGVALGMVRRETEVGTTVRVSWESGESAATVVALPFP